jgi:hypothetical protein
MSVFVLSFTFIFISSAAPQESSSSHSYSGFAAFPLSFLYVSTHVQQLRYNVVAQLLIQNPLPMRRQWREAVLTVFQSATAVTSRDLLSSFAVCPCDLQ